MTLNVNKQKKSLPSKGLCNKQLFWFNRTRVYHYRYLACSLSSFYRYQGIWAGRLSTEEGSFWWSYPQFFLDCIAHTTAGFGTCSILLKTFWLGISFLHFVDAYRERKKLLQHELQALEKEAEARCDVLVSCNCSILILLRSYFSARMYRHWVFLHPFICFNMF